MNHISTMRRTALNDAVAGLIKSIGAHAQGRRSSVLCVIVTDGMENVSRRYRIEDVRQMVTYRRLTHGWQFLFLGPESALDYAVPIGIPRSNFAGFKTTSRGLKQILDRLGRAVKAYALGDRQLAFEKFATKTWPTRPTITPFTKCLLIHPLWPKFFDAER